MLAMRQSCSGIENMPPVAMNIPGRRDTSRTDGTHAGSPSGSPNGNDLTGLPIKEGEVYAMRTVNGRTVRVSVVLKVYSSSFGRYVVVAQNKVICRDCGFINLKHCTVKAAGDGHGLQRSNSVPTSSQVPPSSPLSSSPSSQSRLSSPTKDLHSFQLLPHNSEGQALCFGVKSKTELEQWLSVLVTSEENSEVNPKVTVGSPLRKVLRDISPMRVASPKLGKRLLMPSLEEE